MIEWNKIETADEKLKAAIEVVAASQEVNSYVQTAVESRIAVARDAFKSKMDGLNTKLLSSEEKVKAFEGVNPDDLPIMKAALEKNTELGGMVKQWKDKAEQKEAELEERESRIEALEFNQAMAHNIDKYGAVAGEYQIQSGAHELLVQVAEQRKRKTDDGKVFFTQTDGSPLMSDTGYADGVKFIESLRTEYPFMFSSPTGSGASGSKNNGSAEDWGKYFKPETRNLTKQAELKQRDPALYQQLVGK